jgi:hypothetical protein
MPLMAGKMHEIEFGRLLRAQIADVVPAPIGLTDKWSQLGCKVISHDEFKEWDGTPQSEVSSLSTEFCPGERSGCRSALNDLYPSRAMKKTWQVEIQPRVIWHLGLNPRVYKRTVN